MEKEWEVVTERVLCPSWVKKGDRLDEREFCLYYLENHKLVYNGGAFFTVEGRVTDIGKLRKDIYEEIAPYFTSGFAAKVDRILETLKMEAYMEKLPYQETVIHLANGAYNLSTGFFPQMVHCRYRLPVNYNENAPEPKLWKTFLEQLLEEDDILTLQEYMGYCLLPVTYGQKMLLIIGNGGEGKSRIGVVMKKLFGCNMHQSSIAKIEASPFARADLEHVLVMVDDDMKMEALNQTNYIKSIITAELPMDLERKGIQSHQGDLRVRFMAFGNGNLRALHDRSYGFFRRQIILTTKPRNPDRVDDPYLGKRLEEEAEGIFLWCLEGLFRLIGQDFRFTTSTKTQYNMCCAIEESCNVLEFMNSRGYFLLDKTQSATSRSLYNAYRDWCDDNIHKPLSAHTFTAWLREHAGDYGLTYSNNIHIGNGKTARGFRGIRVLPR